MTKQIWFWRLGYSSFCEKNWFSANENIRNTFSNGSLSSVKWCDYDYGYWLQNTRGDAVSHSHLQHLYQNVMLELRSRLYERPLNRLLLRALSRGDSLRKSGDAPASGSSSSGAGAGGSAQQLLLRAPGAPAAAGNTNASSGSAAASSGAVVESLTADFTERIDEWGVRYVFVGHEHEHITHDH